ncbi:Ldh family oxidoreductase [Lactiplantibacillus garii]|uniref:Ldh family oxidoreductase n=1 Tax=Lactiplantibacillus garii TaxID=2306423 RepID=A0A3R8KL21_9LACO|nr:Ldh family oxidoreductase [Lactiplantibacillus garii]RRK10213.1 Ldh family oxidoreductase [Lactiplantibacillus garii]
MRISAETEREFLQAVFKAQHFSDQDGALLADTLVDADLRGISSHGIQRLAWYTRMIKDHTLEPEQQPKILKESSTSLLIDANKSMGQIASAFTMNKLIAKAKQSSIAMAVIRNSNHFGTAGYYSRMAAKQGLIGISTTNTRPLVVPTNSLEAFLGSNALAFTFPADPHPFVFDGATAVVSSGKIQVLAKKGEQIPGDWAVDENRHVLHDAKTVEDNLAKIAFSEERPGGGVLTLGGQDEVNSNYKGFGNSLIIELLTGILAQGSLSADTNTGKHDFSQFFMVIDPAFFGDLDVLKANVTNMFDRIRHLKHLPGTKIMIPGDREYKHYDENLVQGVSIDEATLDEMRAVGDEFGVTVPSEASVED